MLAGQSGQGVKVARGPEAAEDQLLFQSAATEPTKSPANAKLAPTLLRPRILSGYSNCEGKRLFERVIKLLVEFKDPKSERSEASVDSQLNE